MNRYKFPIDVFRNISDALPTGVHLGFIGDNLVDCYATENDINKLKSTGINLDVITQVKYQKSFDDFISEYQIFPYKIYDWLALNKTGFDKFNTPYDIDFKTDLTITLQKKTLPKSQGKPTSVEYYESKNVRMIGNTPVLDALGNPIFDYVNLICKIDFTLTYDAFGFIIQRKEILRWVKSNGALSTEYKDLGRIFDPILDHESRIQEGYERRQAIIDGLQLPILGMLKSIYSNKSIVEVLMLGRAFLSAFDDSFRAFVQSSLSVTDAQSPDYGKKVVVVEVRNASSTTYPWLDMVVPNAGTLTIRQYIMNELSI